MNMHRTSNRHIYSVSELTTNIKKTLEDNFPFIWIIGEISNRYRPASGHCYFDLKDHAASIRAVIFQGQAKNLKFDPEDGLEVIGLGRISVYEPRGTYQIILEYMEPAGIGALQIAFEQLKRKLEAEGLFAADKKLKLPPLPRTIGVVTSISGAVIHDIMNVLFRRFENVHLIVAPVKVQGAGAENEIAQAIERLNRHAQADIIVLARGGGSLEDLQAFNTEIVARAIQAATIPIVSAVGHEVDYTISDFTADLRAPTPSAAAELIVPEKRELLYRIDTARYHLGRLIRRHLTDHRRRLKDLTTTMKGPRRRIEALRLKLDHLTTRLSHCGEHRIKSERQRVSFNTSILLNLNPNRYTKKYKVKNELLYKNLLNIISMYIIKTQSHRQQLERALTALNPMAILQRGYSITRTITSDPSRIIMDINQVEKDDALEILLARGSLQVNVAAKCDP